LLVAGVVVAVAGDLLTGALLAALGLGDGVLCLVYRQLEPVAYDLDGSGLAIARRGRASRRFAGALSVLSSAKLGMRVAGSGGLYGYLGRFRLVGGGRVTAFVTSRAATVIVRVGETAVAVSPADREGFVRDVEAYRA
jgi:hypothetical protein